MADGSASASSYREWRHDPDEDSGSFGSASLVRAGTGSFSSGWGLSGSSTASRSRSSARSGRGCRSQALWASRRPSSVRRGRPTSWAPAAERSSSATSPTGSGAGGSSWSPSLLYLLATVGTAFAGSFAWFAVFRFLTGLGIGGEYAAINSAIDELIPARVRGWVDLAVNGSFWLGAAFGAALTGILLDTSIFSTDLGWRLGFGLGAILAIGIMLVRRYLPESPRWLMVHGKHEEAEQLVSEIEETVRTRHGSARAPGAGSGDRDPPPREHGVHRHRPHPLQEVPEAFRPRACADGDSGLSLQRRALQLLRPAHRILRRRRQRRRAST